MSILKIPVTATAMPEWVRRCADAVNGVISGLVITEKRTAALETFEGAANTRLTALENFAATPFAVDSIRLKPGALPTSPTKGMTVYDTADDIVKTWNGTAWKNHY